MAFLLFALLKFSAITGEIPYYDRITTGFCGCSRELFEWCIYMTTFVTLLVLRYVGMFISFPLPLIAPFWMDFNPGPTRKSSKYQQVFEAYDSRLMALSHYCIYPWLVLFLGGSTTKWLVSYMKAIDTGQDLINFPSSWMMHRSILWPPDGVLLSGLMLILCIVTPVAVFLYCIG